MQNRSGGLDPERGSMESMRTPNVSAAQVTSYLKGVDFPAEKQKIVDMAKSNGAPDMVVQWLNRLPDKRYNSSTEVEQEFGKLK